MATPTPPVPTPTLVQIDKDLQDALAALAGKHVTVSYVVVGVLVLVLSLTGIGGYFALQQIDKAEARAEVAEKTMEQDKQQYTTALASYQQQLAADTADRAADAQKLAQLELSLVAINKTTQTQVNNVTTPGKSAQEAYVDLINAYKDNKTVSAVTLDTTTDPSGEQLMAFPIPVVQQFSAIKIEGDGCKSDVVNLSEQLDVQKDENTTLNTDLTNNQKALGDLQKTETQCEATVKDYKKLTTPSKFKKIMGVALKVVLFIGGAALGHSL